MRLIRQKEGLIVLAPAKLNLALFVTGRRPNGYHTIKTLMTPITLFDRIIFRPSERWVLSVRGLPAPNDSSNTIMRAVEAFRKHYRVEPPPLSVHLEKRIPPGSGLGGGSSDAAATILALHEFTKTPKDSETDIACALEVGADVPFFLKCQPYWMEGIGQIFAKKAEIGRRTYMLVVPDFTCQTHLVYSAIQLTCGAVSSKIYMGLGENAVTEALWQNQLEEAAARVYPQLRDYIIFLRPYGFRMTGSGSAFFGPPRSDWLLRPPRRLTGARLYLVETCAGVRCF